MNRILYTAAIASMLALSPFTASAAPSPTPSLDTFLATPPAGFSELSTSLLHGQFTADEYASTADPSKQSEVIATLRRDGFAGGYGKTWVSQSSQHVLVEAVIAFTGGRGARNWLTAVEATYKQDARYKHTDSLSGIEPYYGVHIADTQGKTFGDDFGFVKGNDVFEIAVVSTKDDALAQATSQTKSQYDAAPNETIPSSQWPENQATSTDQLAYSMGSIIPVVLVVALIVGVVGLVVARRRRPTAATAAVPAGVVQMSPDGNFWWDGQAWRDAAHEAPPSAQRSSDGAFWWDGRVWRPVPETGSVAQP